jgi:hypothetical protein
VALAARIPIPQTSGRAGTLLLPTSRPLPFFAYPFLVATLLGWAWTLLTDRNARSLADSA